jgi:hypothetical protein
MRLITSVFTACIGLFVDTTNHIYCSETNLHRIIRVPLEGYNEFSIVAGTGASGFLTNMLNRPHGIFVSASLDLYVADELNHRVQRFRFGQRNGTTMAGNGASGTIILHHPISVMLDGNDYLFICEFEGNRIVGSGPFGFRCIVGCSGLLGSAPSEFRKPIRFSFDPMGNLYVADYFNDRIQKFIISNNTCGKFTPHENAKGLSKMPLDLCIFMSDVALYYLFRFFTDDSSVIHHHH